MDFRILGALEVMDGGTRIPIPRTKPKIILGMLLLCRNQTVSTARLAEAVWDANPPRTFANTLQSHVSYLRSIIRATQPNDRAQVHLETHAESYRLVVPNERVDAHRFERLVGEGRTALRASDPVTAAGALQQALALWRGPALADFVDRPFAIGEAARLEELRLVAHEERSDAELALGHHAELVTGLQALVREHPLRERLWGQLMVAYYRCGRQADALRAYEAARRSLAEHVGLVPGPALRRLEADILAQAPSLDWRQPSSPATARRQATPGLDRRGTTADQAVPLPFVVAQSRSSGMAGRGEELSHLLQQWKESSGGTLGISFIAGEPGIGKTRLVSELAFQTHSAGATVLYGRCDEQIETPYRPFAEALQHLAVHVDPSRMPPPASRGDLGRIVTDLGEVEGPHIDAETDRMRLFNAVADWLRLAGEQSPVLLILDDLHWADRSTLLLLRHVSTAQPHSRMMIVGTYRDTDIGPDHHLSQLLADLRRLRPTDRVRLTGLDEAAILELLADRGGAGTTQGSGRRENLARLLRSQTDGNPFFLSELVAQLVSAGISLREDESGGGIERLVERLGVPTGVQEVVRRRLSALAEELSELLSWAAIIGSEFGAEVLAALVGGEMDQVVDQLDVAIRRGLVVEATDGFARYRFAHSLVRQAIEAERSATKRVLLHHRVAQVLEAQGAPTVDLAYHYARAATKADAAKAVHYNRLAAREAAARLALDEAVTFLETALETEALDSPDATRRALLLLDLGEAKNACGRVTEARREFLDAASLARADGNSLLLARAAIGYGGVFAVWVEFGESVGPDLAREALAALPDDDSVERVLCMAKLSGWQTPAPDARFRLQLSADAVSMAEKIGDPAALIPAMLARVFALRGHPGGPKEQLALSAALTSLATSSGQVGLLAEALFDQAVASLLLCDRPTARRAAQELQVLGDRTGLGVALWDAAAIETTLAIAEGRFGELAVLNERERRTGVAVGEAGPLSADAHLAIAAMLREEWAEVADISALMLQRHPRSLAGTGIAATIAWARGDKTEARAALASWCHGALPYTPAEFRFTTAAAMARAAADMGMVEESQRLYEILAPHRGTWCTVGTGPDFGMTEHSLALLVACLGRREEAVDLLRVAIEVYRGTGTNAWLAVGLADLAEVAVEDSEALEAASQAIATAEALGAQNVARRARSAASVR